MNIADLRKPFPPAVVSWRPGSTNKEKTKAMALAYIDARDVQDRFDEVCGAANWQCKFPLSDGKRIICEISIRIDGEWITKADGAGDTDIEGEKGAISDAFKRAAVKWGVGRYLYDLPSPWVEIDQFKRIKDSEHAKLRSLLTKDARENAAPDKPATNDKPPASDKTPLWERSSFALNVSGDQDKWADTFCSAIGKAPSDRALMKLETDNRSHLESLPDDLCDKCQQAMNDRMMFWSQHPTGKVA